VIALLLAAGVVGGHVYAARFEVRDAHITIWRYVHAGSRVGPPAVLFGEAGFDKRIFDPGLAGTLQARGHDVFLPEWRGTGKSDAGPAALGGLDSLVDGDARAALDAALRETGATCANLVGFGLGGVAAYLLASRACAVVAISVPASYEVPNEGVRRLIESMPAAPAEDWLELRPWLALPWPLDALKRIDLGERLLGLSPNAPLRQGAGRIAPQLARDVAAWMKGGGIAPRLAQSLAELRVPLLVVSAPRDNLVHTEHALALKAPHDSIVLSRIEGYRDEAAHLPLPKQLFAEIAQWLESR
jgi:pimeloyl-ACP methyl ester carboxylesterase